MIVRLTAVVLRLSALYFLWQTIIFLGTFQFVLTSQEESGPYFGLILTIITLLLIAGALWYFAKWLAPLFHPYEDQDDAPIRLDVDRLEVVIVQIVGLIVMLLGLHGFLVALLNILAAVIDHDYLPSRAIIFLSLTRGALFSVLGLLMVMRFRGLLHWLSRLRKAGSS